jgi:hypothetical protein
VAFVGRQIVLSLQIGRPGFPPTFFTWVVGSAAMNGAARQGLAFF